MINKWLTNELNKSFILRNIFENMFATFDMMNSIVEFQFDVKFVEFFVTIWYQYVFFSRKFEYSILQMIKKIFSKAKIFRFHDDSNDNDHFVVDVNINRQQQRKIEFVNQKNIVHGQITFAIDVNFTKNKRTNKTSKKIVVKCVEFQMKMIFWIDFCE